MMGGVGGVLDHSCASVQNLGKWETSHMGRGWLGRVDGKTGCACKGAASCAGGLSAAGRGCAEV